MTRTLATVPVYPALLAMAYVASEAEYFTLPLTWLLRPVLVVAGVAVLLQVGSTIVLRSRLVAAYVTLAAMLWLLGQPHWAGAMALPPLVVATASRIGRLRGWPLLPPFTKALNIFAIVLAAITIWSGAAWHVGLLLSPEPESTTAAKGAPDVYLLMLDAYPRADSLSTDFDFDNGPFLDALEQRGLSVASESQSNYNMTLLTLASMMNMRHVSDLADDAGVGPSSSPLDQYQFLARAIARPAALDVFGQQGYATTAVATGFSTELIHADTVIDSGDVTYYEIRLLEDAAARGPLGRWIAAPLAESYRRRIDHAFEAFAEPRGNGAQLVVGHIMAPHHPIVVDADGETAELPACFPTDCGFFAGSIPAPGVSWSAFRDGFIGQLEYVNRQTLRAIDTIVAHSPDAVVIVFSDHGVRHEPHDIDEGFRNLFAARTPGHDALFPNDVTPTIVFPRLLDAYLSVNVPEPSADQFYLPLDEWIPLRYIAAQ